MTSIKFNSIVSRLIWVSQLFILSFNAQGQVDLLTTDPILVYQSTHQILNTEDTFKVKVFNDGFVKVHYPTYMKKSGDYTVQLSQEDLQYLIDALETKSVQNFDIKTIRLQKQTTDKKGKLLSYRSDSSYSSFEVSRKNNSNLKKIKQKINCPDLQFDTKHYPNIISLKKLAEVETFLSKLINRSDIQEMGNE